jgi:hypothetical protein
MLLVAIEFPSYNQKNNQIGLWRIGIAIAMNLLKNLVNSHLNKVKTSTNTSNLHLRKNLEIKQFANSCKVNFRNPMCRIFNIRHQHIEAKNISIEGKKVTHQLRAIGKNNSYYSCYRS